MLFQKNQAESKWGFEMILKRMILSYESFKMISSLMTAVNPHCNKCLHPQKMGEFGRFGVAYLIAAAAALAGRVALATSQLCARRTAAARCTAFWCVIRPRGRT